MDRLFLQIVTRTGALVRIPGGGELERDLIAIAAEAILENCSAPLWEAVAQGLASDLVDRVTEAVAQHHVGVLATQTRVLAQVRTSVAEALDQAHRAKRADLSMPTYVTHGEVRAAVESGIKRAMQTLKDDTRFALGVP